MLRPKQAVRGRFQGLPNDVWTLGKRISSSIRNNTLDIVILRPK